VDTGIPLTTRQVSAIRDYVAGGGGLILFLGDRTDISVHNESLLPKLFGCSIQGRAGSPGQRGAYLSLTGMDYEHPIFRILKPSSAGLIDAPRFYASFRMSAATPSSVLARFSDGSPAMVEGKAGRGRALLFGSTVKTAWSDLSLKSLFVPLMHRGVRYVYRPEMVDQVAGKPGVPLERPVRWSPSTGGLTLVYPSGTTERVNPMVTPQGASVVVTGTEEPGIYRIQAGDDLLRVFTVNVDTGESEPERLSHEEAEQRIGAVQGRLITGEIASEATVFQSPDGYEIWKSLIFLALVLLLLEAWLTRLPTAPKERTG
jgi:hypothetical protein